MKQPFRAFLPLTLVLGTVAALLFAACAPAAPPTPTPAPPKPAAPAPAAQPTLAAPKPAAPTVAPTPAPKPAAPAPTAAPAPKPAATAAAKPGAREKLSFMLAFRASGSYSPFYLARDKGFFAEQGLDVEIIEGSGSANAAKVVASGSSPMGTTDGGIVIQSVAEGLPIKVVAGLIQTSPMSVIVPKASGITNPKGLEGKKIGGAPGGAGEVLLPGWLKLNGANPDKVQMVSVTAATRLTTLLQGQVDGMVGFYYDNVPILKDRGLDVVALRYADFGFNVPGISIVVNASFAKEKPDVVRRFVAAALKGHAEAKRDPKAAIAAVQKQASALNEKLETEALVGMLELFQSKRTQGKPMGWMAPEDWEDAIKILGEHAGLKQRPKVADVMTNEFVPAQ